MIIDFNRFVIFYSNNCWILTKEKVASSYLKDRFETEWLEVDINNFSLEIHHINFEHTQNAQISKQNYAEIQEKFESDWNDLISNNNKSNKFIFLLRNPINKFITGWVQDSILRKLNDGYRQREYERLETIFTNDEVKSFSNYITNRITKEQQLGQIYFPDVEDLPLKYKDIFEEFCFPKNNDFFKNDIQTYLDLTTAGHPSENLYLIWRLCFGKSINFDCSDIHIIDIDLQHLELSLGEKFDIRFVEKNVNYNKRGEYLKNRAYSYLAKNHKCVNSILQIEILFWYEIINKIYPKERYDSNISSLLKPITLYKKTYFIPEHLDFYNFQTHMNWFTYEPKVVHLTYTN